MTISLNQNLTLRASPLQTLQLALLRHGLAQVCVPSNAEGGQGKHTRSAFRLSINSRTLRGTYFCYSLAACWKEGCIMREYWVKADLQFSCPSCKQVSSVTIVARSEKKPVGVEDLKPIACQHCKAICPDRVEIQLSVKDLTPGELASLPDTIFPLRKRAR